MKLDDLDKILKDIDATRKVLTYSWSGTEVEGSPTLVNLKQVEILASYAQAAKDTIVDLRKQLIEKGYAYYSPKTGEFEVLEPKPQG